MGPIRSAWCCCPATIIGANGDLTGYGGGMARKQWLLEHEGVLPAAAQQMSLFA